MVGSDGSGGVVGGVEGGWDEVSGGSGDPESDFGGSDEGGSGDGVRVDGGGLGGGSFDGGSLLRGGRLDSGGSLEPGGVDGGSSEDGGGVDDSGSEAGGPDGDGSFDPGSPDCGFSLEAGGVDSPGGVDSGVGVGVGDGGGNSRSNSRPSRGNRPSGSSVSWPGGGGGGTVGGGWVGVGPHGGQGSGSVSSSGDGLTGGGAELDGGGLCSLGPDDGGPEGAGPVGSSDVPGPVVDGRGELLGGWAGSDGGTGGRVDELLGRGCRLDVGWPDGSWRPGSLGLDFSGRSGSTIRAFDHGPDLPLRVARTWITWTFMSSLNQRTEATTLPVSSTSKPFSRTWYVTSLPEDASQEIWAQSSVIRPARRPVTVLGAPATGRDWAEAIGSRSASGMESAALSPSSPACSACDGSRWPEVWSADVTRRGEVSSSSGEPVTAGTQ